LPGSDGCRNCYRHFGLLGDEGGWLCFENCVYAHEVVLVFMYDVESGCGMSILTALRNLQGPKGPCLT
jgi:hypothetical protein